MEYTEFTTKMKSEYTILAPDIFPIHLKLVAQVFRQSGFNIEVMTYTGKKVLDTGLKYIHNDMCYPAICSLGQLLYAVTCGDYDPHKVALIHFQTGGGCRASNYIKLLRKALKNMGMDYIPVISMNFSGLEHHSGFNLTLPLLYKSFVSLVYGDMLMLLYNQVRPYVVHEGDAEKTLNKWIDDLSSQFIKNKGLSLGAIRRNLENIAKDFAGLELTNEKKPKVGIVGEIYVKYAPFGNNDLENFLFSQGCEYMVPGVLAFFEYCLYSPIKDNVLYGSSMKGRIISSVALKLMSMIERLIAKALVPYPRFTPPGEFEHLVKLADKVMNTGVKMGEGWCLPAEMAELIEKGYPNIVCAQPFGCLPNHVIGKGIARHIKDIYPEANICQVDYDPGATKVNQENRIKLMIAVARENMQAAESDHINN